MTDTQQIVVISTLELARVAFPNGRVTSGAGQAYMRRLDAIFQKDAFRAILHTRQWTKDPYLTDLADSGHCFNLTYAESKQVVRRIP